jgi:hypothetical protein
VQAADAGGWGRGGRVGHGAAIMARRAAVKKCAWSRPGAARS